MVKRGLLVQLLLFFLAACSTTEPTPTMVAIVNTVPVERPTPTVTIRPTAEPTFTDLIPTVRPSQPPLPTATISQTVTATTSPTPSLVELLDLEPLPHLIWTDERQVVAYIDEAARVSWSPLTNAFASTNCIGPLGYTSVVRLLKVSAPDFISIDITPDTDAVQGLCDSGVKGLVWTQDGQEIVFVGATPDLTLLLEGSLWIMNKEGMNAHPISLDENNLIKFPGLIGWTGLETLFYSEYTGDGRDIGYLIDVQTGQLLNSIGPVFGTFGQINANYVAMLDQQNAPLEPIEKETAAVIPLYDSQSAPPNTIEVFQGYLSSARVYSLALEIGSRFQDWLSGTNDMLLTTWEEGITHNEAVRTDLQLWRVDEGELVLLVPNGRDGNFSPDGRYLAYILPTNESDEVEGLEFNLEILDRRTGQVIFSRPSEDSVPVWSPASDRLVFNSPSDGLTVLNVESGSFRPLVESGAIRLRMPQWSYDGRYLSVGVWQDDGTWGTAVLQLPDK